MGETVEFPLDDFEADDPKVTALQMVALPFNDQSIQVVAIAHVRTDEEQAQFEEARALFGLDVLEDLGDLD